MFIEMGRPYRPPGDRPPGDGPPGDPRARNCSPLFCPFSQYGFSSAVMFHGERGRGRSKEARLDRGSSPGSGVLRKRLDESRGLVPNADDARG